MLVNAKIAVASETLFFQLQDIITKLDLTIEEAMSAICHLFILTATTTNDPRKAVNLALEWLVEIEDSTDLDRLIKRAREDFESLKKNQ